MKNFIKRFLYTLFVSFGVVIATASAEPPPAPQYKLDSGDRVHVRVFGEEDLTGDFEVDGNGSVAFPLIGTIAAKGLSARELEQAVVDKLNQGYLVDPKVSVEVLTYRPFYILGEVKNPGSYPFVNGMTVLNAVALAGGFTYRAAEDTAQVKRATDPSVETEVDPTANIYPGDVITIKERYF